MTFGNSKLIECSKHHWAAIMQPCPHCENEILRATIERLEQNTCDVCSPEDYGWQHNRVEGRVPCICMEEAEPYQILKAEIERLREADERAHGYAEFWKNKYEKALKGEG